VDLASTSVVRLNFETRIHHDAADLFLRSLLVPKVTCTEYIDRLATAYGFMAPFEAACAYTRGLRDLLDLRARSRAGALAEDLLELGLTPSELSAVPHCFPLAPFASCIEALGWVYVVERETLIHETVRRHVVAELPEVRGATAYLTSYRDVAGARWHELGRVLDATVGNDQREELVAAAHAGFRCLLDWYSQPRYELARGA
jgi:heme oxygenase